MLSFFTKQPRYRTSGLEEKMFSIFDLSDNAFPNADYIKPNTELEDYLRRGHVQNAEKYEELLKCSLENAGSYSLPFVRDAHRASYTDLVSLDATQETCLADKTKAREASIKQGSSLIFCARRTFRSDQFQHLQNLLTSKVIHGHHAVMFGFICAGLNIKLHHTLEMFMLGVIRSILATAMKLGAMDAVRAQMLQKCVQERIPEIVRRNMERSIHRVEVTTHLQSSVTIKQEPLDDFVFKKPSLQDSNSVLLKLLHS